MIKEILILSALGGGLVVATDPQAQEVIANAIKNITNPQQTTQQNQTSQNQGSGIGFSKLYEALQQLFSNQAQLQQELANNPYLVPTSSAPPLTITYPSPSSSGGSGSSLIDYLLQHQQQQQSPTATQLPTYTPSASAPPYQPTYAPGGSAPFRAITSPIGTITSSSTNPDYTTPGSITSNSSGGYSVSGYLFGSIPVGTQVSSTGQQTSGYYSPISLSSTTPTTTTPTTTSTTTPTTPPVTSSNSNNNSFINSLNSGQWYNPIPTTTTPPVTSSNSNSNYNNFINNMNTNANQLAHFYNI